MNTTRLYAVVGLCVMVLAGGMLGCGRDGTDAERESGDGHEKHHHDHDDRPESYAAAVREIKQHGEEVAQAFSSGKPDDAHDALHDLGDLLSALPDVAADTDMSKKDWNEVKQASKRLFDDYGDLDLIMHDDDDAKSQAASKFSGVEGDIESAMKILDAKLAASSEEPLDAAVSEDRQAAESNDYEHEHEHEHQHDHEDEQEHDHSHASEKSNETK